MKLNRWSWGYIPIALVLGLIWFEFWRSGAFKPADQAAPAPDNSDTALASPDTPPAPATPAPATPAVPENPVVVIGPIVSSTPVSPSRVPVVPVAPPIGAPPPLPLTPEAPVKPVLDDAFLHNPPPISVSISGESLNGTVDAIRESFHMPANLSAQDNGGRNQTYTLDVKNKPFWEVVRSLQSQGGFGFYPSGPGLTFSSSYSPLYHFEISGPVAVAPMNVTYLRSVPAQSPADRSPGTYRISFGIAVDPRIPLARLYPLEVLEATDEAGRNVPVNNQTGTSSGVQSNYWQNTLMVPEPAVRPHSLTLKANVRFAALLSTGTAVVEDASQKSGETFTLGDRKLRLARSEIQGTTYILQVTADDGSAVNDVTCTLSDSTGRTTNFSITGTGTRSFPASTFQAPYRLSFTDGSAGQEVTVPVEFKEIALP